jgi:hypothetical protein
MKQSLRVTVLFTLALLFCFAMPVGAFEIGARALYWFPSLNADIRVNDSGVTGNILNLKDTLGVKDGSFPSFEVFIGHGNHLLNIAYTPLAYSGSSTLTRDINFNGHTYATGSRVYTEFGLKMLDVEYRYTLVDMENFLAGGSLNLIAQVKYIDSEAKINEPATNTGSAAKLRAPIPMVGLGVHVGLLHDILEVRAKVTGIVYSSSYFYEAMAALSYTPFPFLDIQAGYKTIRLKIDYSDVFLDLGFAGPFVGLTLSY